MNKQKGFSLIELLVVITILGVLAAIGLTSYRTANMKARDSRRQADIQAIRSALEVYRADKDEYPSKLDDSEFNSNLYFSEGHVPQDPSSDGCGYDYTTTAVQQSYTLTYCMETGDNPGVLIPVYSP